MSTDSTVAVRHAGRNTSHVVADESGIALLKRFDGPADDRDRRFRNTLDWDLVQGIRGDDFSPRVVRHDVGSRQVWFPYLDSAHTIQSLVEARTSWVELADVLRRCGRRIGEVHSLTGEALVLELVRARPVDAVPPDPLAMFRALTGEQYAEASGGELECWALFHHDGELVDALDDWVASQRHDPAIAPIHGDLRPDQYLVDDAGIHLIDWEEWTVGPVTRDLAGMVGAIVFDALHGALASAAATPGGVSEVHATVMARAGEALADVGTATSAFLEGYAATSPHQVDEVRLGRATGWALLERVLARAMFSHRLTTIDKAIAGIGRQALVHPAAATALLRQEAVHATA